MAGLNLLAEVWPKRFAESKPNEMKKWKKVCFAF
jgi:hypothetical protein